MPGTLDGLRNDLRSKTLSVAVAAAREWEQDLRRTSPVDTGEMVSRTTVTARPTPTGARIDAVVDTDYAEMVSEGTRPHIITPRKQGGVLRFVVNGRTVFARIVHHPGARPNTWWKDALDNLPNLLRRLW